MYLQLLSFCKLSNKLIIQMPQLKEEYRINEIRGIANRFVKSGDQETITTTENRAI